MGSGGGLGTQKQEIAYRKLYWAKATYESTLRTTLEASAKYNKTAVKMEVLIGELASIKVESIGLGQVKSVLERGVRCLGEMCNQWAILDIFFKSINALVCTATSSLASLDERSASVMDRRQQVISSFETRLVFETAGAAGSQALIVHTVARLYKEISGQFILPPLNTINLLTRFQASQHRAIEAEMSDLRSKCTESQRAIAETVQSAYEAYERQLRESIEAMSVKLERMRLRMAHDMPVTTPPSEG